VVPRDWICLIYHDVSAAPIGTTGGSAFFSVSQSVFARHLSLVQELGLRGCSIADALAQPSVPRVAISFDDGDLGQATRAFPALAARGMTATFFVTTGWIGRPEYASWDQLREMRAAGMSIQSHTHSHPFLSELDEPALRDELRRSRDLLDDRLGQSTNMIAFPGGDPPRRDLRPLLAAEGYTVIGTSRWGRNSSVEGGEPRYVRRCTVRGEMGDERFSAIARGDRWLGVKKELREGVLRFVRSSLGPSRYARWRRSALNLVGSRSVSQP
jgi:peptidoglycan/xylan/chitin deacetylase (PgdA/CDA1 family)